MQNVILTDLQFTNNHKRPLSDVNSFGIILKSYKILTLKYITGGNFMRPIILNGTYRHYKGNYYKVLHIARHSESLEDLVVYQAQYGDHNVWVRPLSMFLENVCRNGETFERFSYVSPDVNTQLSISLDSDLERYMYENGIDLVSELKKEFPDIKCQDEPSTDGSKDVGLTILCCGAAAALVILAVSKLVDVISHKPRYINVEEFDIDGNITKKHTELLQPNTPKSTLSIGFEIDATKATLKIEDRKE